MFRVHYKSCLASADCRPCACAMIWQSPEHFALTINSQHKLSMSKEECLGIEEMCPKMWEQKKVSFQYGIFDVNYGSGWSFRTPPRGADAGSIESRDSWFIRCLVISPYLIFLSGKVWLSCTYRCNCT